MRLAVDFSSATNIPEFLQIGILFSSEKTHIKELHKTPLEKISRGSLVKTGECKEQLVISHEKTHPGRGCGKGMFINVGS